MKTKLPVHVADDPLRAVARGTGIALKTSGYISLPYEVMTESR